MTLPDPAVRAATPADAAAIAGVQVASWRAAYAGLIPARQLAAMSAGERAETHARRLSEGAARAVDLVAERDGVVVGWASVGPARDEDLDAAVAGEIYAIYAVPGVWSTGVGSALMQSALGHLVRADFGTVSLWVLERNHRARLFYERWRFGADGARQLLDLGASVAEVRYLLPDLQAVPDRRPGPDV